MTAPRCDVSPWRLPRERERDDVDPPADDVDPDPFDEEPTPVCRACGCEVDTDEADDDAAEFICVTCSAAEDNEPCDT